MPDSAHEARRYGVSVLGAEVELEDEDLGAGDRAGHHQGQGVVDTCHTHQIEYPYLFMILGESTRFEESQLAKQPPTNKMCER